MIFKEATGNSCEGTCGGGVSNCLMKIIKTTIVFQGFSFNILKESNEGNSIFKLYKFYFMLKTLV